MANRIPPDEFQQRLKKVQEAMQREKFDALVVFSQKRGHIPYLSGYQPNYHTNAGLMLVTAERDPALWIKFAFDLPRAKATSWLEDVRLCASDDEGDVAGMIATCAVEIRSRRLEGSRIGLVGSDLAVDELSNSFHERIRRELPKALAEDVVDIHPLAEAELQLEHAVYH